MSVVEWSSADKGALSNRQASTDTPAGGSERATTGAASRMVAEMMRTAIIKRELLPGEHVRQQDWAKRANVSRPPIREALEVLASEGLLEHSLHRGYFVAKVSLHEMRQLYLMRRLLETETAKTVAWPSDAQVEELTALAEKAKAAAEVGDGVEHRDLVTEFLLSVHRLSSDQLIFAQVLELWKRTAAYRALAFGAVKLGNVGSGVIDIVLKALKERNRDSLVDALLRPTIESHNYIERELAS